ncbi:MAG: hypothetical protein ACK5JF_13410 [Oscillospiraceae bacterium]
MKNLIKEEVKNAFFDSKRKNKEFRKKVEATANMNSQRHDAAKSKIQKVRAAIQKTK